MIKIDLVTGFLGSGKTTFLQQYARFLMRRGLRIGILEYDYGAVNVDMMLLGQLRGENCELEMVSAGCDADCLQRRFRTKLIQMAMSGYDRVIIEPSGIFDMDRFFDTLREEPLDSRYEIGSVIAIVNAKPEKTEREGSFLLASQAACAGCILLSRTQNASAEEIAETKAGLEQAAKEIQCSRDFSGLYLEKDWKTLDEADWLRLMNCGYSTAEYEKLPAERIEKAYMTVYFLGQVCSLRSLREKIAKLFSTEEYGHILRVKGCVMDDGVWHQVNAARGEITVQPMSRGQSAVIVIGSDLQKEKLRAMMAG